MAKLVLDDIGSTLTNTAATTINNNNTKIEQALENTLSRDGSTPNNMQADIDMDSNDILNVKQIDVETLVLNGEVVQAVEIAGALKASNALSEIAVLGLQEEARDNLELGGISTRDVGDFLFKVETFSLASSAQIPTSVTTVYVVNRGARFSRVSSEPTHALKFFNGGWWSINEPKLFLTMAGAVGDGITNDSQAFLDANSVKKTIHLTPGHTYLIDTIDWSDRSNIVPIEGNGAEFKKRLDDGSQLCVINNNTVGASGYVGPNIINNVTFNADGKANYAFIAYHIARWKFSNKCKFLNAKQDGALLLGGAGNVFDSPDAIGNGRAGIAFDKYSYGSGENFPNANTINTAGIFDNGQWGIYFDAGRELYINDCDIEGNGDAASALTAGIRVGSTVGTEAGTTVRPGVIIKGGWIEGNKGTTGAVIFASGLNRIIGGYFCANATNFDVFATSGGKYTITDTVFDGVRTHVKDDATAGVNNSIYNCTIGGSHDIIASKTSVDDAQQIWTSYTPTLSSDTGTITTPAATTGQFRRVGRTVYLKVSGGITTAGTAAGDLRVTLPTGLTPRGNWTVFGVLGSGTSGGITGVAQNASTFFRARRSSDGTTIIANGLDFTLNLTYELS